MNSLTKDAFKMKIEAKIGTNFQKFIDELFLLKYGGDNYIPIRRTKDKGNDGTVVKEKKILACYAPDKYNKKNFEKKVKEDFKKYKEHWEKKYPNWEMLVNHEISPDQLNLVKSLNGNTSIKGITQILSIIDDLDSSKRIRLAEYLGIDKFLNQNYILRHPTILIDVINRLSDIFSEDTDTVEGSLTVPSPEDKINYNNITKKYKFIIDEYKVYQGKLNKIYKEIENQGSKKKEILLKNIHTLYLKEKGKYRDFEEIKTHSDDIFKSIESELWDRIKSSGEEGIYLEVLQMSILIIMVDAFMRCEILEKPPRDDSE